MKIDKLTYRYGNMEALQDISLQIGEEDFFAIFGQDDAGKTTLLRLLMEFDIPSQGNIIWEGEENEDLKKRTVRFVPDDIIWEQSLTIQQYLDFAKRAEKNYDLEFQAMLCGKFAVPLKEQLLNVTYQQNKLTQLIAALCARPDFIILDEPMNFLEESVYHEILELLQEMNSKGTGVLVAVEKYRHIGKYCRHYAYMKEGRITAIGEVPPFDFRKKVVTIVNGQKQIDELMDGRIIQKGDRTVYLYQKDIGRLPEILQKAECQDFIVEEMELEEELENDFSRWE